MDPSFWKDKRVFVTGHTGFKGSWLTLLLQRLKANVTGFSFSPEETSLFNQARVSDGITSLAGDVRELSSLSSAIQDSQAEIVLHLAAQSLVRRSYQDPVNTFSTNVMGTVNILESVRNCPSVKAVIIVTSDKCYENREWLWGYRENEAMGGFDPYSSSKGAAELVAASYRRSFLNDGRVGVASVRAGNVIGGGDWAADRLFPDVMRAFLNGESVIIRSPKAVRPWQHVLEPLTGYLLLAERLWCAPKEFAEPFNLGPSETETVSVEKVLTLIASLWRDKVSWVADGSTHPHEAGVLRLDCTKARTKLGWSPRTDLSQAVAETVDWYLAFGKSRDMREMTLGQIDVHLKHLQAKTRQ
jgi:CDP-glucose 4,6-dehydratase